MWTTTGGRGRCLSQRAAGGHNPLESMCQMYIRICWKTHAPVPHQSNHCAYMHQQCLKRASGSNNAHVAHAAEHCKDYTSMFRLHFILSWLPPPSLTVAAQVFQGEGSQMPATNALEQPHLSCQVFVKEGDFAAASGVRQQIVDRAILTWVQHQTLILQIPASLHHAHFLCLQSQYSN